MISTEPAALQPEPAPAEPGQPDGPRPSRPAWGRAAQLGVAAVAAALYLANLSVNALGNPYYAAAVKSGSVSWKAFFFGSLDPGSFITVDKPPAAFWVQAISVRIFGYSTWSILVPEAVAGAAAVAIVYHVARRITRARTEAADTAGPEIVGIVAGLALAVTPIATVMFRFNDPDALLTLFLTLAAWVGWVAIERGSIKHLVGAGVLIGLAFLSKELVTAIAVPGLALAWIVAAPTTLKRRLLGWLWSGIALLVSAGWWVAAVELWPASDRPYIGSSTNNDIISVIFGYNGLSRLFGGHGGGATHRGATTGRGFAAGGFGGAGTRRLGGGTGGAFGAGAGWTRMFSTTLGSQISWLLPLAGLGLVVGLMVSGRRPRTDLRRAAYILWGGWALAGFVVFSKSSGTFHPYYVVAVAPPIALVAALGATDLWAVGRRHRALCWLLPAGVIGSGAWAFVLLHRSASYHPWLRVAVLVVAVLGAGGLLGASLWNRDGVTGARLTAFAGTLAVIALLAGPTAWSLSSITHASNGTNPTAGPASAETTEFGGGARAGGFGFGRTGSTRAGGFGGRTAATSSGPSTADKRFVAWLEAHRHGAKYLVAVDSSMSADDLIIASGKPVMAMGGFSGSDPTPTLAQFEKLVREGQVRYVLIGSTGSGFGGAGFGGGGFGGGGFGGPVRSEAAAGESHPVGTETDTGGFGGVAGGRGGNSAVTAVEKWVEAHGTKVPTSEWGGDASGTLYEVTPATVAKS